MSQCLNVSGSVDIALKSSELQEFDLDLADGVDKLHVSGTGSILYPVPAPRFCRRAKLTDPIGVLSVIGDLTPSAIS